MHFGRGRVGWGSFRTYISVSPLCCTATTRLSRSRSDVRASDMAPCPHAHQATHRTPALPATAPLP